MFLYFSAIGHVQRGGSPGSFDLLLGTRLGDQFYWIHLVGFALALGGIGMVTWAHWLSEKEAKRKQQEYTPFHACPC